MNKLLPQKEELQPILKNTSTFYDCGFNEEFEKMSFIKKLQVVNDIVRQTIFPQICSDITTEQDTLIGNCHTSSLISIQYLKELGIGVNHRYVMARKKSYEPSDITSKHALVLVDDEYGNTYEFDATPFVGYGYGKVKLKDDNPLYEEYIEIDNEKLSLLNEMRKFLYDQYNKLLNEEKVNYYLKIFEQASHFEVFNGFVSYCYKLLYDYQPVNLDKEYLLRQSIIYNPYNVLNPDKSYLKRKQEMTEKQISIWKQELHLLGTELENLLKVDDLNSPQNKEKYLRILKRRLELSQLIVQESKLFDTSYEKYLNFKECEIPYSYLTPRFFYENELNVVIVKASAYRLGVRGTIREKMLGKGTKAIGEHFSNFSKPTLDTGLKPILYSHTLGAEYERSMNGIADTFLVAEPAESLYAKKRILRDELGKNLYYKYVEWFDGEKILWHPFVTNLVHSTDNPSEAALHYLMSYPEHQVMTRFMYPNPKLERVIKK